MTSGNTAVIKSRSSAAKTAENLNRHNNVHRMTEALHPIEAEQIATFITTRRCLKKDI